MQLSGCEGGNVSGIVVATAAALPPLLPFPAPLPAPLGPLERFQLHGGVWGAWLWLLLPSWGVWGWDRGWGRGDTHPSLLRSSSQPRSSGFTQPGGPSPPPHGPCSDLRGKMGGLGSSIHQEHKSFWRNEAVTVGLAGVGLWGAGVKKTGVCASSQ